MGQRGLRNLCIDGASRNGLDAARPVQPDVPGGARVLEHRRLCLRNLFQHHQHNRTDPKDDDNTDQLPADCNRSGRSTYDGFVSALLGLFLLLWSP